MSQKIIYFDSNVYADFIRQGVKADLIKNILDRNKLVLAISSLNLFEAASCWKSRNPETINQGIKRFQLFRDLLPCRFLREVPEIVFGEIDKALNNRVLSIFYDGVEAENEINKLANGTYDDRAKTFIESKWSVKSLEIQRRAEYFNQIRGLPIPDYFDEFLSCHQQEFAEHLIGERIIGIPAKHKRKLAEKMLQKSQKFPLFDSMIRANLFLDFRLFKFKTVSHDTLDDVKHLIIASHVDIFVSNDEKLHKYSHDITTPLKVMKFNEFMDLTIQRLINKTTSCKIRPLGGVFYPNPL